MTAQGKPLRSNNGGRVFLCNSTFSPPSLVELRRDPFAGCLASCGITGFWIKRTNLEVHPSSLRALASSRENLYSPRIILRILSSDAIQKHPVKAEQTFGGPGMGAISPVFQRLEKRLHKLPMIGKVR